MSESIYPCWTITQLTVISILTRVLCYMRVLYTLIVTIVAGHMYQTQMLMVPHQSPLTLGSGRRTTRYRW